MESEDGSFRIDGLPAGPISFEAFSPAGMTERPVDAVLTADEDSSTSVRLILAAADEFRGAVLTPNGALTAAAVWCAPSMRPPVAVRIATGVDGGFRFTKARSVEWMTCTVSAPAFAARLFRVSAVRREPLPVFMTQVGATLAVTVPVPEAGRRPFLFHDHAAIHVGAFAYLTSAHANGSQISAYVEEGDWSLCMWTDDEVGAAEVGRPPMQRCRTTRAVAGGRAELSF